MSDAAGRCESCAAFFGARTDERLGKVGTCALEIYPPPVRASATCARYRPKGAPAPPPRPRVAGEPRGQRSFGSSARSSASSNSGSGPSGNAGTQALGAAPSLPQEVDIDMDIEEFRRVLREVITSELGVSRPPLGARWQGGELVLKPGKSDTQEKRIPIESFFHKIVMVRDKLRLLEAKVNSHPALSDEDKVLLHSYITGCYGSLTTFNVLFSEKGDQFVGQSQG